MVVENAPALIIERQFGTWRVGGPHVGIANATWREQC
jgi:hypothetical protein